MTAHYAERNQHNQDEVRRAKEALRNWQMAKQHESQRISQVMELGSKPAAATSSTARPATAGAGGTTPRSPLAPGVPHKS